MSTDEKSKGPHFTEKAEKRAQEKRRRQADQLRANLKRRRQQAREQSRTADVEKDDSPA